MTPPTQFYKVVCPKCGADVPKPVKVWELKGGKSKKNVLIGLFQCQDCRVKFREALTREII
ncbi:chorismate-binding protein [Candidatus Bathyarchaeota archaeon]|nr:MAG: chorismate-binding protein [Candidatus Bathyarchaeota archaeon]TMI32821.1 MAG: chorismate-binding protein [Candidatus Bathyarchaeota archaeon]